MEWLHLQDAIERGDQQALIQLLRKYEKHIYSLALYLLKQEEGANMVSQRVLVRIYREWKPFRNEQEFLGWVQILLFQACLEYKKESAGGRLNDHCD